MATATKKENSKLSSTLSVVPGISTAGHFTTPLLTRFSPPPTCVTSWYYVDFTYLQTPSWLVTGYIHIVGKDCQLKTLVAEPHTQVPVVFSPGACPYNYTPATTWDYGNFNHATTSICCSQGLTMIIGGNLGGNCGNTITTARKTFYQPSGVLHQTGPNQTVVDTFYFVDLPYTVAWASSQLGLFHPTKLPLIVASEAAASRQPNLSVGAQAGVGIAVAALGLSIGAIIMWLCRRRYRRRKHMQLIEIEGEEKKGSRMPSVPELDGKEGSVEVAAMERPQEMFVEAAKEVEPDRGASEADNNDMRHELDAGYSGEQLDDITTPIRDEASVYAEER